MWLLIFFRILINLFRCLLLVCLLVSGSGLVQGVVFIFIVLIVGLQLEGVFLLQGNCMLMGNMWENFIWFMLYIFWRICLYFLICRLQFFFLMGLIFVLRILFFLLVWKLMNLQLKIVVLLLLNRNSRLMVLMVFLFLLKIFCLGSICSFLLGLIWVWYFCIWLKIWLMFFFSVVYVLGVIFDGLGYVFFVSLVLVQFFVILWVKVFIFWRNLDWGLLFIVCIFFLVLFLWNIVFWVLVI